ncbi:MAG: DUF3857 domain-containing protein [Flavobacteriales bacterium]
MYRRILLLLIAAFGLFNGFAQRDRAEFVWPDTMGHIAVDETKHPEEEVRVRVWEHVHLGELPEETDGERVYSTWYGTINTRMIRYLFRTRASIDAFLGQATKCPAGQAVNFFDARIIRKDGEVIDLSSKHCSIVYVYDTVYRSMDRRPELRFEDVDLRPGDQFEVVLSLRSSGLRMGQEVLIQEERAVLEKQLEIHMWDAPNLSVHTYNGFPAPTAVVHGTHRVKQWTFHDLKPIPFLPYAVSHFEQPFYTISTSRHLDPLQCLSLFQQEHKYNHYAGRKSKYDFLDFLGERIQQHGAGKHTAIVRDVVAFLRDSIRMVPDEELDRNEPVGRHFAQRRMSTEMLLHLYKQMFSVLGTPMYICFARDRYLVAVSADTLHGEDLTDHVLAFKDEQSGAPHYLAINTLWNRYLVDEVPYWLAGQRAVMIEYSETKIKPEQRVIKLPGMLPSDNLLMERYRVEMQPAGLPRCQGRGVLTAALRQSWDADPMASTLDPWLRPDLRTPQQRHMAVDSVSVEQSIPSRSKYRFRPLPPAVSNSTTEAGWHVDLERMISPPTFGTSERSVPANSLLPYPYVQRYDVIISFPVDVELVGDGSRVSKENVFGKVNVSCEQRDPRTIHWHMDHTLLNTWVDRDRLPIYLDLMQALSDPSSFGFSVKKASSPGTSLASPPDQEAAPR